MMADLCGAASLPPTPLYAAPTLSTPTRSQAKLSEERTDWTVKRLPTCAPMACHSSNTIEVARASADSEELACKGSRTHPHTHTHTHTHTETCAARSLEHTHTRDVCCKKDRVLGNKTRHSHLNTDLSSSTSRSSDGSNEAQQILTSSTAAAGTKEALPSAAYHRTYLGKK